MSDRSKITIKNLHAKKRPISAVADNIEVRNAKKIIIKTNRNIKFNLLYDKNRSLQKKIKIEQIRRETSWFKVKLRLKNEKSPFISFILFHFIEL